MHTDFVHRLWTKTLNIPQGGSTFIEKQNTMRALKFYDKEGVGFEFYLDHVKQSITLQVDNDETPEEINYLEIDESDLDDIIISLVELKNELTAMKNVGNN